MSPFSGVIRVLFLMLATAALAGGHTMAQVRSKLEVSDGTWTGRVFLEAWALYPQGGPKMPLGTPGSEDFADSDWAASLSEEDFAGMREAATEFLTESFQLGVDGKPLPFTTEFPDFEESPLRFELSPGGNAMIEVILRGAGELPAEGDLQIVWNDDIDETLALQVKHIDEAGKERLEVFRIDRQNPPLTLLRLGSGKGNEGSTSSSLWTWIVAGFEHILPKGLDHILFILGLFLLVQKWKPLLWQTTAFTLAHSITLAMVVLGVFTVPASVVEPAIALSIAYVGIENLWTDKLHSWRVVLVFALGLLHGMGFASVMQELDIPEGSVMKPLVGFNLGVELGQVTVLCGAFLLTFWMLGKDSFKTVRKVASALIGLMGLYWTFERIFL